jgi:peptide/nickel transport system permease protein
MILETAGLSFLGLGAQPPTADLGSMLGDGRDLLLTAPHVAVLPGVAILVLVIGINLVGDGLRDLLDPRLAAGALSRPVARTDRAPAAERRAELAADAGEALLDVRGLATSFATGGEPVRAVDQLDLRVQPGETVGIVGESGSGKSVTALSILGLVASPPGRIDKGAIRYRGEDLLEVPLARLQDVRGDRIAYIFQDPQATLNPLMRVVDQVTETVARHRGGAARAEAEALLARVGLEGRGDARPHELSGGQRQRVGIAMALANGPDVLIADEPTTALDVTTQARVLDMLDGLRRDEGAALVFITHDLGVVSELCARLVVMYAGKVVESGPTATVFAEPRHPYTKRLLECVPVLGEPDRALHPIEGMPPALDDLPPGCAFAPRCPFAEHACRAGLIPLETVGPEHRARCRRHRELARG